MSTKTLKQQLDALQKEVLTQKQIIAELSKSEQQYRTAFEDANDLIHCVDAEGYFLYTNRLWRKTLGYADDEIRGMKIFDIVDPEYQPKCRCIFDCMMRGEAAPPTETVFITKDGLRIIVEGHCNPKFENGKAVELLGVFRDITARKQLEAEREALIASLKKATEQVKTLEGFIPICASCKKVRDDSGYWNQVETYIQNHSNAVFSHCMCPDCCSKLYPELFKKDK